MNRNGHSTAGSPTACGLAVQGRPPLMLRLACRSLEREGLSLVSLPTCIGDACAWSREIAECLRTGDCQRVLIACTEGDVCCCVANKVPGIRAAQAASVWQAERALLGLGANVLVVELADRTYFEFKQILRLCCAAPLTCPPGVECVLRELETHAHR